MAFTIPQAEASLGFGLGGASLGDGASGLAVAEASVSLGSYIFSFSAVPPGAVYVLVTSDVRSSLEVSSEVTGLAVAGRPYMEVSSSSSDVGVGNMRKGLVIEK